MAQHEQAGLESDSTGIVADPSVRVASMPWAFTQRQPLDTARLIDEMKRRGLDVDLPTLRELYRHKLLVPFVYLNDRRVGPVPAPVTDEPWPGGTRLQQLRYARDRGRLSDLEAAPFRPRLQFALPSGRDVRRWWNGFLYSWYQLLICPEIDALLSHRTRRRSADGKVRTRLPEPHPILVAQAGRFHRMAIALTALEARYLPKLDPEWLHLNNAEVGQWQRYRDDFDPVAMSTQLGYSAADARRDAEWLLSRARTLDPVGDSWSELMRRAPSKSRKDLKGVALSALDYRIAAEILLLFHEDLADHGQVEPLPSIPRNSWHPLHERLSYRHQTLDQDLMDLGISPHPRVVLAVEGETEQAHVPIVWKELGYPNAPELMRLLWLGGVDKDLEKVAALASAPLVGERAPTQQPAWLAIKPPTRLLIAVDPEGKYFAPQNVGKTRTAILNEIRAVLRAQGVEDPNPAELEQLIEIRTWSESCYEFAHFYDEELADGIMAIHDTIDGWTRDELVEALGYWRDRRADIKRVWESGRWDEQRQTVTGPWAYKVSKTKLAEALWPTLKAKIDRCRADEQAPVPEIVQVVQSAYLQAQQWRYLSFLLTELPETPGTSV
jgi:hypothetical protein